jgi:hypothetical protein
MSDRIRSLLRRVASTNESTDPNDQMLRERVPPGRSVASLEREVASEIAYSLGKAGSKLEAGISRALATRAEIDALAPGSSEREKLIARYREERALAEKYLRDLLIQREALGFRRHAELFANYPIPPRIPSE